MSSLPKVLITAFLLPVAGYGGALSGTFETGVQADNREDDEVYLAHLGYLSYLSDDANLEATIDYLLKTDNESELNQLYGQFRLPQYDSVATLGRFNRFDNLGYYTLDGIQLVQHQDHRQIQFYGGQPRRTDDTHTLTGDYLYGIEALFTQPLDTQPLSDSVDDAPLHWRRPTPSVAYRIGLQQLKQGTTASWLNLGASYKNNWDFLASERQEVDFTGSYQFEQDRFEDLLFDSRFYADNQNYLQLTYEYYDPDRNSPGFREFFYTSYAIGAQQLAEAAFHHIESDGLTWMVAGRKTSRENSNTNGYGFRASLEAQPWPYVDVLAELDTLTVGDDKIESLWLAGSNSPDSKTRLSLETGLQFENKSLYGFNRALGFRARYEYMINREFFLTATAQQLLNSRRANEYLLNCYIVYYLYRG